MKFKSIISLFYKFLLFSSVIFIISCKKNGETQGTQTFYTDPQKKSKTNSSDQSTPTPSGPIKPSIGGSSENTKQDSQGQRNYFYYQVKLNGKTSYILGTMHAGIEDDYYSDKIINQFKKCDTILVEGNGAQFKEKYTSEIQSRLPLAENDLTENHLSPEGFSKLINIFNHYNINYEDFKNRKAYAYNAYIESIADRQLQTQTQLNWNFDSAIDGQLLTMALADSNKKVLYLDDEGFILNSIINDIDTTYTWQDLENLLAHTDPVQHLMDCSLAGRNVYLSGVLENLNAVLQSQCTRPVFFEETNFRSKQWHPMILKAISAGNACAAFGAAHLINDGGILEALESQGFEIILQKNL